ncbi:hypothetical protein HYR54_07780 [Candidatus Acetothermia bacterium]|nr:hypothetical protein [Candidatus Acetothermia bacterium]MBI3460206.1 hypothetical protein [Candidatus Acetothermia bacterium]
MALTRDALRKILDAAFATKTNYIGCDECLAQLDQYVEQVLVGKEIPEALQLVQEHLEDCPECEEEYLALLTALREGLEENGPS